MWSNDPASTRRWIDVGLTLVQRLSRWTNVKETLIKRILSAGVGVYAKVTLSDMLISWVEK